MMTNSYGDFVCPNHGIRIYGEEIKAEEYARVEKAKKNKK